MPLKGLFGQVFSMKRGDLSMKKCKHNLHECFYTGQIMIKNIYQNMVAF